MFDGGFGGVEVFEEDFDFDGGAVGVCHYGEVVKVDVLWEFKRRIWRCFVRKRLRRDIESIGQCLLCDVGSA